MPQATPPDERKHHLSFPEEYQEEEQVDSTNEPENVEEENVDSTHEPQSSEGVTQPAQVLNVKKPSCTWNRKCIFVFYVSSNQQLISISDDHPLLDHQLVCLEFVEELVRDSNFMGALIADEMGLGKTGIVCVTFIHKFSSVISALFVMELFFIINH
jgi:SNF2 family DNA or RNA helicase